MYSAAMLKVFIRVLMAVEFHILYILICVEKKFEIYRIIFEQKFDFRKLDMYQTIMVLFHNLNFFKKISDIFYKQLEIQLLVE